MSSYQLPAALKQVPHTRRSDKERDSCWQQLEDGLFIQKCEIKATATLAGMRAERVVLGFAYAERHGYAGDRIPSREE